MPLGGAPMARPMRCLQDRAATNPARANRLFLSLNHQLMTRHSQNRFDTGSPMRDSSQARLVLRTKGSWVRILPAAPKINDLGPPNQVFHVTAGPLRDPLSTGAAS